MATKSLSQTDKTISCFTSSSDSRSIFSSPLLTDITKYHFVPLQEIIEKTTEILKSGNHIDKCQWYRPPIHYWVVENYQVIDKDGEFERQVSTALAVDGYKLQYRNYYEIYGYCSDDDEYHRYNNYWELIGEYTAIKVRN